MISAAIGQLVAQLNEALKRGANVPHEIVRASNLIEQNGNVVPDVENKVVMFLVNVERETLPYKASSGRMGSGMRFADGQPPVHLNLSVMIAANFSGRHYPDALRYLSNAISYFQRNPVFDHSNTPALDARIYRLVLEIENLGVNELGNLWGILGGKYVPSILYKVRMITFDSNDLIGVTPAIGTTESAAGVSR